MEILGKAREDLETIYLHPKVCRIIKKLTKITGRRKGFLIRNVRGTDNITAKQINNEVKRLFKSCGIRKKVHGLRHFYITNLLNIGINVREVQKLARHKKIETTIRYDDEINIKKKAEEINRKLSLNV